jgi:hypothetical protein
MIRPAKQKPITHEQKVMLCTRSDITLNGRPARISGPRERFATIIDRGTGLGAQWAWETVARVCAADGAFRS